MLLEAILWINVVLVVSFRNDGVSFRSGLCITQILRTVLAVAHPAGAAELEGCASLARVTTGRVGSLTDFYLVSPRVGIQGLQTAVQRLDAG